MYAVPLSHVIYALRKRRVALLKHQPYRIKPEPKSDTIDGETGKLKKVELL